MRRLSYLLFNSLLDDDKKSVYIILAHENKASFFIYTRGSMHPHFYSNVYKDLWVMSLAECGLFIDSIPLTHSGNVKAINIAKDQSPDDLE